VREKGIERTWAWGGEKVVGLTVYLGVTGEATALSPKNTSISSKRSFWIKTQEKSGGGKKGILKNFSSREKTTKQGLETQLRMSLQ